VFALLSNVDSAVSYGISYGIQDSGGSQATGDNEFAGLRNCNAYRMGQQLVFYKNISQYPGKNTQRTQKRIPFTPKASSGGVKRRQKYPPVQTQADIFVVVKHSMFPC